MKTCVIHDLPEFTVTSYGNGLAYCLAHKPSQRDILFQGGDAAQFRDELDALTQGAPALDYGVTLGDDVTLGNYVRLGNRVTLGDMRRDYSPYVLTGGMDIGSMGVAQSAARQLRARGIACFVELI